MFAGLIVNTTGQITRVIQVTVERDLALQHREPGETLIPVSSDAGVVQTPTRFYLDGGTVVPKAQIPLVVTQSTFAADGDEEVAITAVGLTQDCLIQVNGQRRTVTPTDPTVVVTSDVPGPFVAQVPPEEPHYWSEPVTITAI